MDFSNTINLILRQLLRNLWFYGYIIRSYLFTPCNHFENYGKIMENVQILIIDDETDVLDILSLRLSKRGALTTCSDCGRTGLELLQNNPIDVVILDIKMPAMDGSEVLERIKEIKPDVPVIILSGHADMKLAAQVIQEGAFAYLLKPIDIDMLCNKIEDALEHQKHLGVQSSND